MFKCFKAIGLVLGFSILLTSMARAGLPDWKKTVGEFTVNMGIVSSYYPFIDCWKHHSEKDGIVDIREEENHHLFFVIRDTKTDRSMKVKSVALNIHTPSGNTIVSESLHPETNYGTIEYCDFLSFKQEGTYIIELRFMMEGKLYKVNFSVG